MSLPFSWTSPVIASRTLVGFPDGQSWGRCPSSSCLCGSSTPLLCIMGFGYRTTSSGDKGIPRQGHWLLFSGVSVCHPSYLPQGKVKNISYGCGPSGHLACPFNMVPVHRDKQTGSERGVGRDASQVCGGCPAPTMSLRHQLGDTTRNSS